MRRTQWALGASLIAAAWVCPAAAQGIVKGAQEGATVGNRAAGPVGGAVGGAVGGVAGGVAGGVKGVLGIPQNTSTHRAPRKHAASAVMVPDAMRTALVGHPVLWKSQNGRQTATATFDEDGTAHLAEANLDGMPEDTGRWEIKDKAFCVTWDKAPLGRSKPGEEACSTWRKTGAKTYRSAHGDVVTLP
jgi:hypothetical protein